MPTSATLDYHARLRYPSPLGCFLRKSGGKDACSSPDSASSNQPIAGESQKPWRIRRISRWWDGGLRCHTVCMHLYYANKSALSASIQRIHREDCVTICSRSNRYPAFAHLAFSLMWKTRVPRWLSTPLRSFGVLNPRLGPLSHGSNHYHR